MTAGDAKLPLSFSQVQQYQTCPRKWAYERRERIIPPTRSGALVFGKAFDEGANATLAAIAEGAANEDAAQAGIAAFLASWETALQQPRPVKWGRHDRRQLGSMGQTMLKGLPGVWAESGLVIARLPDGAPAIQVPLAADLGDGVTYRGVIDLLAWDADGYLGIVDVKTASSAAQAGFALHAPQLLDYQLLMDLAGGGLGFGPGDLQWAAFLEAVKKAAPTVALTPPARRHDAQDLAERLADIHEVARGIRERRFPRRAGMAFDSPCRMCDFAPLCYGGDTSGFTYPAPQVIVTPAMLAGQPARPSTTIPATEAAEAAGA